MAKVRLRGKENGAESRTTEGQEVVAPIPLKPLQVAGVVVRRQVIEEILRLWIPTLESFQAFEGEDYYFLKFRPETSE